MNIKHHTLQLTQKEPPIGFDYHGLYDALVVATPGGVSFYKIIDNGTPNQVFYYDESRKMKGVRVQQHDKAWIAAMHDKEVTLWDPKNPVAPMHHALVASSGVTDCQWSKEDPNMFSMTLNSGIVSIWDLRSLTRPAQQLLLGRKSQKMEWCPVDRHLVAVSTENKYVLLWDTRKLPGSATSSMPLNADECYMLLEPELGLVDFTWASEASPYNAAAAGSPYIWTISEVSNILGLHMVSRPNQIFHSSLEISHHSKACVSKPKVVAQPHGQSLMLYYEDKEDSLTKFNYINVNHHHNIDADVTIAKSCGKIIGGHWRHGHPSSSMVEQKSFLAFTSAGQLHILDEIKQNYSHGYDEKIVSKVRSSFDGPASGGTKAKVKSAFNPLKSATTGMTSIQHSDIDLGSPHNLTNSLVGPKTFLILIKDEVSAFGAALQHGTLEGIRVGGIDHFHRQIVLEMLIPAADPFIINDFNARSNGHFRQQELDNFYNNGALGRTVELSMVFPVKRSEFWENPKFSLENKSNHEIDEETMDSIVEEVAAWTATRASQKRQTFRHGGRNGNTLNESILVNIAKIACKRIIQTWQKKTVEGMNFSFGSHKQSQDDFSIVSPEVKHEIDEGQAIYTICLQKTEARAFCVPFPVVSAGLFNGRGELILFGNAQLRLPATASRPLCQYVENIGAAAYPGSGSLNNTKPDNGEGNPKLKKHKSYAHLLANKYMKKSTSEGAVSNKSCTTETTENNTISTKHSASQHSHHLSFSHHSKPGKFDNRPIGDLDFNGEDEDEDDDEDTSTGSKDEETSSSDEDEDVDDDGEFDYNPGFDFEESKGLPSTSQSKSKRRVSYNQRPEPVVDQSSMLPVRKYSNLSDYSATQYFVADLESKYSECSAEGELKPRDQRVEFTVYESLQKTRQFLAKHYSLGPVKVINSWQDDLPVRVAACRHNMQIVEKYFPGNRSLVQFWSLLAVCLDVSAITDAGGLISWNHSALGRSLFHKLMEYIVTSKDVQMWAVAVCVIGNVKSMLGLLSSEQQRTIYYNIHSKKESPSNSESGSTCYALKIYMEVIMYRYSQILQQWGEILKSTDVMNHMSDLDDIADYHNYAERQFPIPRAQSDKMSLSIRCMFCNTEVEDRSDLEYSMAEYKIKMKKENPTSQILFDAKQEAIKKPWCLQCNVFGIYCAICLLPVRSVASICGKCGHGGHEHDLSAWFAKYSECPAGCGCHCRSSVEDNSNEDEVIRFVDDDSENGSVSPDRNPVARSVFRSISFRMLSQANYMPYPDTFMFGNDDYFL